MFAERYQQLSEKKKLNRLYGALSLASNHGCMHKGNNNYFFPQKGYPEVEASESKILGQTITRMVVPTRCPLADGCRVLWAT